MTETMQAQQPNLQILRVIYWASIDQDFTDTNNLL